MDKINIDLESVQEIIKKLGLLQEDGILLLSEADKAVTSAELNGWKDNRYFEFKDLFDEMKYSIYNNLKKIDEELLPKLRKIKEMADEY